MAEKADCSIGTNNIPVSIEAITEGRVLNTIPDISCLCDISSLSSQVEDSDIIPSLILLLSTAIIVVEYMLASTNSGAEKYQTALVTFANKNKTSTKMDIDANLQEHI